MTIYRISLGNLCCKYKDRVKSPTLEWNITEINASPIENRSLADGREIFSHRKCNKPKKMKAN